ncbi:MAG: TlpA family protein disulfide reductase [Pseudonocardiaceae bacterium]
MRVALRWLMVAVLLALALFVALGPRPDTDPDTEPDTGPDPAGAGPPGRSMDLNQLRARAALQPCPAPAAEDAAATAAPVPVGPLAGVVLPCLGTAGSVDLGAALAGRPALLNLWGPLCRPCAEEVPALARYAAEPGAVPVLGVEVQQLPEGALDMLSTLGVHYPSVSDPDGRLRGALQAPPVLPLSFVVSADGHVSQVTPPSVLRSPEQVRAVVHRYLGPGATG